MENETVADLLLSALVSGTDWAEAALKNTPPVNRVKKAKSLKAALFIAFHWGQSPEGQAYWAGIYDSLQGSSDIEGQ